MLSFLFIQLFILEVKMKKTNKVNFFQFLLSIHKGIEAGHESITVIDHERVLYNPSGVTLHMCGDGFNLARGDVTYLTNDDMSDNEKQLISKIRGLIRPTDLILERREIAFKLIVDKEPLNEGVVTVDNDNDEEFEL